MILPLSQIKKSCRRASSGRSNQGYRADGAHPRLSDRAGYMTKDDHGIGMEGRARSVTRLTNSLMPELPAQDGPAILERSTYTVQVCA